MAQRATLSGFAVAVVGFSMLSGALPAATASPTSVPASHSSYDRGHGKNECWDANFYEHRGHWHVTWRDSEGMHNERADSFRGAVGELVDNCDRYSDPDNVRDLGRDKERDRNR